MKCLKFHISPTSKIQKDNFITLTKNNIAAKKLKEKTEKAAAENKVVNHSTTTALTVARKEKPGYSQFIIPIGMTPTVAHYYYSGTSLDLPIGANGILRCSHCNNDIGFVKRQVSTMKDTDNEMYCVHCGSTVVIPPHFRMLFNPKAYMEPHVHFNLLKNMVASLNYKSQPEGYVINLEATPWNKGGSA